VLTLSACFIEASEQHHGVATPLRRWRWELQLLVIAWSGSSTSELPDALRMV
jgi:hypothetical protein